jgi:hypothetical protein
MICVYEDDASSDVGMGIVVKRTSTTLSKDGVGEEDPFTEAATSLTDVVALDDYNFLTFYADDADSSNGVYNVGKVKNHLIDVRSTSTSISFGGYMMHLEKSGLGMFAHYRLTGTTNASANTAMSSLKTLPWKRHPNIFMLWKDTGLYIEDDGSVVPYKSGVSSSSRTIDIRSTSTSVAFEIYLLKINGKMRVHTV